MEKYLIFKEKINNMDVMFNEFLKSVDESLEGMKPFSKCGKCKRLMKILEKVGKMHCDTCNIDLEVPKDGKYKIRSENTCPLDGYQIGKYTIIKIYNYFIYLYIVSFTTNHEPHVTSNICPYCYTNSPELE